MAIDKRSGVSAAVLFVVAGQFSLAADATQKSLPFVTDGAVVHQLSSPYQSRPTRLTILLPDGMEKGKHYSVVYFLPVEAGDEHRYGDSLAEAKRHDLPNRYNVICAFPTFAQLPWYADHPTDPEIRQERHFVEVVVPFVQRNYPARAERDGRLLVGFSKSGWGAWTLLLRHPELFGKAAAWDAPLTEASPARFGMGPIFGTQENFEDYRVTSLLKKRAAELGGKPRLVLLGYGNFRAAHVAIHEQANSLNIPHIYRDGPARKHDWHSGWLAEAVQFLFAP